MTKTSIALAIFVLSLGYSLVTGPFRGADEFNHFFRAYQISTGRMIARHAPFGVVGDELPASLLALAAKAADFPKIPAIKLSSAQFRAAGRIQLNENQRHITGFPNSALYSPLGYLPPATGITLGRLFSAPPLWLFYLARCFSAVFVSALLIFAVKTLPVSAESFLVLPFLPMVLFQTAMISADGITIGLGLCFTAEILRLRSNLQPIDRFSRFKFLFLALLLSQLRPPYPLIGMAILSVPRECFCDARDNYRFVALFLLALIVPCFLWNWVAAGLFSEMRPDLTTDSAQQLSLLFRAPSLFLTSLRTEFIDHGFRHFQELIGYLGWRNFPVPWPLIIVIAMMLLISLCSIDTAALKLRFRTRLFFLAIATGGLIGAILAIYLTWDAIGGTEVVGFHGRYFLPFLPFAMIGLANSGLKNVRWCRQVAVAICFLCNLAVLGLLARATYY